MNYLKKYYFLIPVVLILLELTINLNYNFKSELSPSSSKNSFVQQLLTNLGYLKLTPKNITIRQFQSEVEFLLPTNQNTFFPVIFSTKKDILLQVAALQKLFEIANIRHRNIQFIDLSSPRPYATL